MTQPILEARGLSRSFGHVRALTGADFDIYPGEVVAIIGDNGAGKSTLVKALTGNLALDEGEIFFEGKRVNISTPQEASALGMEVVYQDLALAPHLNPVQNMFLGREIPRGGILGHFGFMDEKSMLDAAVKGFAELGGTVRALHAPIGSMSGGQRQQVAIARAIITHPEVILYDSPTGGLDPVTSTTIVELIIKQRDVSQTSALLVSHRLQDAFTMATHYFDQKANRMVPMAPNSRKDIPVTFMVLRDGKIIFDGDAQELAASRDEYIREYIS